MRAFTPEHLGETKIISFLGTDDNKVRLVTAVQDSGDGIMTGVRMNKNGELIFGWEAYTGESREVYQPPIAVMIELQNRLRSVVQPYVSGNTFDREGLIDAIGFGGHHGG